MSTNPEDYVNLDFRIRANNPEFNNSLTIEQKNNIIELRNKLKKKIINKKYYEKKKLKNKCV